MKNICKVKAIHRIAGIIAFVAIIGFSMAACGGGGDSPGPIPYVPTTTVYTAGYYSNGSIDIACYWKNGAKTDLETTNNSNANAIAVAGSDVYVAGWYYDGSNNVACYWKGTAKTDLSTDESYANGIVVTVE